MVSAWLTESYSVVDVGAILEDDTPSWSFVDVADADERAEMNIDKISDTLYSVTSPNGETVELGIDGAGNPTTFGDYQITQFSKSLADASSCPTCGIVTGTVGGNLVEKMTAEEIANVAAVEENGRMLTNHRELQGSVEGNHHCFATSKFLLFVFLGEIRRGYFMSLQDFIKQFTDVSFWLHFGFYSI